MCEKLTEALGGMFGSAKQMITSQQGSVMHTRRLKECESPLNDPFSMSFSIPPDRLRPFFIRRDRKEGAGRGEGGKEEKKVNNRVLTHKISVQSFLSLSTNKKWSSRVMHGPYNEKKQQQTNKQLQRKKHISRANG